MSTKDNNELLIYKAVYHDKVTFTRDLKSKTLGDIFNAIKTNDSLKSQINKLRSIQSEEEQREFKKENLPYFNLGVFENQHRKNINFKGSSFFIYDYDHLDDNLDELKSRFQNDENIFAFFISPRGNGLKVIYRLENEITDPAFFSQLYKHYANKFKIDLGTDPDTTSDPSRACFFSYDPELYVNTNALPLQTDVIIKTAITPQSKKDSDLTDSLVDNIMIQRAIGILSKQKISYNEWLACGFALAPLGEYGRQLFHLLSTNPNFKDSYADIERKFQELQMNTDKYNDIQTLYSIASNYGFQALSLGTAEAQTTTIPFDKELEEQFLLDDSRDPNKLLGFPLTKFKELAGHVDGLQPGFYLLGAESNIGKTAVLTNMCLDVLETNPEITVLYFSLDDSRKYTAYRFLSIITQLSINDTHKQQTDPVRKRTRNLGRKYLLDLIQTNRLIVKDTSETCTIDQLKSVVQAIPDKSKLVVFIDGLYNLEVGDKFRGGIREENIERARQIKLLVDIYRLPVLTTGELRKKSKDEGKDKAPTVHDLMETGKFAYNANVVWLLYGSWEDLKTDEPTLTMEYVKNKVSDYKGYQYLRFKRATGTISEVPQIQLATQQPTAPLFNNGGGLD